MIGYLMDPVKANEIPPIVYLFGSLSLRETAMPCHDRRTRGPYGLQSSLEPQRLWTSSKVVDTFVHHGHFCGPLRIHEHGYLFNFLTLVHLGTGRIHRISY